MSITLLSVRRVWQTQVSSNVTAVGLAGTNLGAADNSPYLAAPRVTSR